MRGGEDQDGARAVQVVFEHALELEGLLELLTDERLDLALDDPARPILLAVSDNGPPMAATETRAFMTLMAIAQHRGRPHTPTDRAWIESFFGHVKGEWPHLEDLDDPVVLEAELARVRTEYNTVRLHEAIGYVTPDDEHHGRGEAIRVARRQGPARARQERLDHHRRHTNQNPEEATVTWFITGTISAAKSDTPHPHRRSGLMNTSNTCVPTCAEGSLYETYWLWNSSDGYFSSAPPGD